MVNTDSGAKKLFPYAPFPHLLSGTSPWFLVTRKQDDHVSPIVQERPLLLSKAPCLERQLIDDFT